MGMNLEYNIEGKMRLANRLEIVYLKITDSLSTSSVIVAGLLLATIVSCGGPVASQETASHLEPDLSSHPVYSSYNFSNETTVIDIGIQPLWIPPGIITETMKRDGLLQKTLAELGMELRFHPFLKGADVNFFLKRGDLEIAIAGDMPTLTASASGDTTVTTLIQYGYTSIVARQHMLVTELKGKKVAYGFGSNAHFALLNSMSAVGLTEADVDLVRLDVNEMPAALGEGTIDAFSAWEPTPTITQTQFDDIVIVQRSTTTGYLYFSKSFAEQYPDIVSQIVASEIRALNWLKDTDQNLLEASKWTLQAGSELSGQAIPLSATDYANIAKDDLVGSAISPLILEKHLKPDGRLYREFLFLQQIGMIASDVKWEEIQSRFNLNIANKVLINSEEFQLEEYDYRPE